jgi:uncharacterized protein (TIRG00374 family)
MTADKQKRTMVKWVGGTLTLVFLLCVIGLMDFEQAASLYRKLSAVSLVMAAMSYLASLCLRAYRFKWLLSRISKKSLPFSQLFPVVLIHNFYNRILPFRVGEAAYVMLLKTSYDYKMSQGLSSLVLARIYDGLTVIVIFILSLLFFTLKTRATHLLFLSGFLLVLILLLLHQLSFTLSLFQRLLHWSGLFLNLSENRFFKRAEQEMVETGRDLETLNRAGSIFPLFLFSTGIWICVFGMFYIMMHGYQLVPFSVSAFWQVVAGSAFSVVTFCLPVNVASGPMELTWVIGFGMIGMDRGAALASGFDVNLFAHAATTLFAVFALICMAIKKRS